MELLTGTEAPRRRGSTEGSVGRVDARTIVSPADDAAVSRRRELSRRSVRSPQDGSALSVPGLRPKPSFYIREETLGKVGQVDDAAVSIVAPIQDELRQAVARIQDGGENQQVTAFTTAKPKGKREMPRVGMNDHAEPFTSYRRQDVVRNHGPRSNHMLRARLHYPLPLIGCKELPPILGG